jgi:HEAT repeat protein
MIERQGPGAGKAIATMSIGESLDNASDGFDPTTYIQSLQFKLRCYEASGEDFQRLFEDIIKRVTPEFMQIRPYGNIGDRKCDGLLYADGTIFQVYSPDALKQAQLKKKINEDLDGAVKHWGDTLKKWVFVYNVRQGLAPDILKILQQKQKQYRNIEIDHWSNHYLWQMARGLSLQQRAEVLGAPVFEKLEQLGFKPQKNAVCQFLQDIEDNFKSIRLFHTQQEIVLKQQYIPIQVTLERKYRHEVETTWGYAESEAELKRAYALKGIVEESQRSQVDWEEAKNKHKRIIVLADPGMGKSTLLKRQAGLTAQGEIQKLSEDDQTVDDVIFPLFLKLSELDEKAEEIINAIPSLIHRDYPNTSPVINVLLKEKLKTGKCLMLLDALDEVPKEHQNRLKEKLNRFARNNPCPIICTSRIVGYGGAFVEGAKEVEIVPFSQKQTEEYIETWFTNAAGYIDDESVSADGLIQELRHKPQIGGLAQNPLLLSLLCSLYQEKGLMLPARRVQLYEKAVDYMLSKWGQNRKPQSEGKIRAKVRLLEELAYHFSCEGKEIFSSDELYDWIEEYLQGEKVPTVFREADTAELMTELSEEDGIIQKLAREGDRYLFLHRTFQEYLTACYLKRARDSIALAKEHFWEYEWHETLSLLAGLMENSVPLLQAITDEKDDIFSTLLLLAGRCVAECEEISHPLIAEIIDRIYNFWQSYPNAGFIKSIVVAIGQGSSQMLERLQKGLKDENIITRLQTATASGEDPFQILAHKDNIVRLKAASALGQIGNSKAIPALISALNDEDIRVEWLAIEALGQIGSFRAVTALTSVLDHKEWQNRTGAVKALGQIDNSQALMALICALNHKYSDVRTKAAETLGQISNPEAVRALNSALKHEDSNVRRQTAIVLEQREKYHASKVLISNLNNEDNRVKWGAATALAQMGYEQGFDVLISALNGNNGDFIEAVWALGNIRTSQVVTALISTLNHKEHDFFRRLVVHALGETGSPQAVTTLISTLNDKNWSVRESAAEALGKVGNPQAVAALICALNREDSGVRRKVAEALIKIGTSETLGKLIQLPEIDIYDSDIFLLARTLAVRFSKGKQPFIPVDPELVAHKQ